MFQNYSTKNLGSFGSSIATKLFGAFLLIIIFIILYLIRKPIGPIFLPNKWNHLGIKYALYDGLFYTVGLLLLGVSFYLNGKIEKPLNIGS